MSKVSLKDIFGGFQLTTSENKYTFMKKSCTVYNHSDALARQVLRDLFSTNQRSDSRMTFVAGINDLMTCCRKQSKDINYILMKDLNLLQILVEVLLELIS